MTVAASQAATTLPQTDLATAFASLQAAVAQLNDALTALQAQLGTGAAAGAATLGGGPAGSGCSCSGATGALGGAEQIGQAPPAKGDTGASDVDAAPEAAKADDPAPVQQAEASGGGSSLGEKMVAEAKKHLGAKYVWGAAGPDSFDCSGLVLAVAKKFGIDLPHKASMQATKGTAVDKKDLEPGDLVYFRTERGISHIGMYVGDDKFIHAPGTGKDVRISSLSESWYRDKYAGARRLG